MTVFICGFIPKKLAIANGAVALATSLDAKTAKLAEMNAIMRLEEEFPGSSDNFFKPKICPDRVGLARPAMDEFSDSYLVSNQWNDEIKEFEAVAPVDTGNDDHYLDENGAVSFFKLPIDIRVATVVLFSDKELEIEDVATAEQFLSDDDADPEQTAIIVALAEIAPVSGMNRVGIKKLIEAINRKFDEEFPPFTEIRKFAEQLIYNPPKDESNVTAFKKTTTTDSGATLGKPTDRTPGIEHTVTALDLEIACAIQPGDGYEVDSIPGAIMRRAKEIIAKQDQQWSCWSRKLRATPGILEFSRAAIFNLIRIAPIDIHRDDGAHREFINSNLVEPKAEKSSNKPAETVSNDAVQVTNHGDGKFSTDGLTGDGAQTEQTSNLTKQPDIETKAAKTVTEQPKTTTKAANDATDTQIHASADIQQAPVPDQFQIRAELVANEIESKSDDAKANLKIWQQVQRTDPSFTKPLEGMGFSGTSINSEYMFMRATEIFGPVGTGWGFETIEDRMIPGAPMSEAVYDDNKKFLHNKMLRDADGTLICELNHSLKITFWYLNECGQRSELIAYGATPYLYKTKHGIKADNEVVKKSLTDAIKKALSMLGFSADVYLGYHDNAEYLAENNIEFGLKNAVDKAGDVTRLRTELDEKLTKVAETLKTAVTKNEAEKVLGGIAREVEIHRKNAESIGDREHAKYLASRLARLNKIKTERVAELEASAQEKTA